MSAQYIGVTRGGNTTSSNTAASISRSASTLTGDLMVAMFEVRNSTSGPLVDAPDNTWTRVPGTNGGANAGMTFPSGGSGTIGNVQIWWKLATTDGAQSYSFTLSGGAVHVWECVVLRGADTPAVLGSGSNSTATSITTAAITTTQADQFILRVVGGTLSSGSTVMHTGIVWDAACTGIINVQGSGAGTGLAWMSSSYEIGPTSAGSVSGRSVTLPNAPNGDATVTLGISSSGGGGGTPAPVNSSVPVITTDGSPVTGESVTTDNGTWTNSPTAYSYQWKRNGSSISGATTSSYVLQVADEGQSVTSTVTATNAGGSASSDSVAIVPSTPPAVVAPVNTAPPTITTDGTPQVGETVTCAPGSWDGLPTAYTYQWRRSGIAISGSTATTYVITSSDVGTDKLSCSVTATNSGGSTTANAASISPASSPLSWRNATVYRLSNGDWV